MKHKLKKHLPQKQHSSQPLSLSDKNTWIIFVTLLLLGLYLRFYNIESTFNFGWDQARDAWVVQEILHGNFTLIGPKTGIGQMHLGPVYYYALAPFFYLFNFDPMASNYFNILANILNFVLIFYVAKKVFGNVSAIIVTGIYTFSHYLIAVNQIPWNVTLMPGVAALIFYTIIQIYDGRYKWIFLLWALSGFYFNLHFTAIFLPIINILSLIFVKDRQKAITYTLLSIPLYLLWFVPSIIYDILSKGGDSNLLKNFFKDYYIGFHFQFFLHRMSDALIQFEKIIHDPFSKYLKFIVPLMFCIVVCFERDKRKRLIGYLLSLWFIVPWIGFTTYGGPLSEYYFLYNAPMVLFVFAYLLNKLLLIKKKPILILVVFSLIFYIFQNTKDLWIKPEYGGLKKQKDEVRARIKQGETFEYAEGDINAYLYNIWVVHKK